MPSVLAISQIFSRSSIFDDGLRFCLIVRNQNWTVSCAALSMGCILSDAVAWTMIFHERGLAVTRTDPFKGANDSCVVIFHHHHHHHLSHHHHHFSVKDRFQFNGLWSMTISTTIWSTTRPKGRVLQKGMACLLRRIRASVYCIVVPPGMAGSKAAQRVSLDHVQTGRRNDTSNGSPPPYNDASRNNNNKNKKPSNNTSNNKTAAASPS